jgi:Uma2 family endonuclease
MSVAKDLEIQLLEADLESEDIAFPPGDLWSDEPPLESELHLRQILLLIQALEWLWRTDGPSPKTDYYAFGNLTIYYNQNQLKSQDFRGPDFFVVLGANPKPRKSWVVWEEGGKYPNVIIELLSGSTAKVDRGEKKQIYQDTFRTPDYFWFDPQSLEFRGFHLVDGRYQELLPDERGWLWSEQLKLFLGIQDSQLRFFTPEGELVNVPREVVEIEQQRAEEERQRAEAEQQRAEEERQRAEAEQQRAEEERQRAEAEQQRAEEERQRAESAEALLARYRQQFGDLPES